MGITKNRQSKEKIINMAKAVFPEKGEPEIRELTEGMCNAAYELTYEDGFNDIVNIGLHFFLKNVRPYAASGSEA